MSFVLRIKRVVKIGCEVTQNSCTIQEKDKLWPIKMGNPNATDEEVISRIVNRRSCPKCRKGYNLITKKPLVDGLCDDCKVPLVQRDDDTEETVKEEKQNGDEFTYKMAREFAFKGKIQKTASKIYRKVVEAFSGRQVTYPD